MVSQQILLGLEVKLEHFFLFFCRILVWHFGAIEILNFFHAHHEATYCAIVVKVLFNTWGRQQFRIVKSRILQLVNI